MTAPMTEAQIAEIERLAKQDHLVRSESLSLIAALRAEREARERAELRAADAMETTEDAIRRESHVSERLLAEIERAERAERALANEKLQRELAEEIVRRYQGDRATMVKDAVEEACRWRDEAVKRAVTAEEAVLVLHEALQPFRNYCLLPLDLYQDDAGYTLPVRVGDMRAGSAAMKHHAVLAVMQRQESEHG